MRTFKEYLLAEGIDVGGESLLTESLIDGPWEKVFETLKLRNEEIALTSPSTITAACDQFSKVLRELKQYPSVSLNNDRTKEILSQLSKFVKSNVDSDDSFLYKAGEEAWSEGIEKLIDERCSAPKLGELIIKDRPYIERKNGKIKILVSAKKVKFSNAVWATLEKYFRLESNLKAVKFREMLREALDEQENTDYTEDNEYISRLLRPTSHEDAATRIAHEFDLINLPSEYESVKDFLLDLGKNALTTIPIEIAKYSILGDS